MIIMEREIELIYRRRPTVFEIKLGYGATHFLTITLVGSCQSPYAGHCLHADGTPKKWFNCPFTGSRYSLVSERIAS